MIKSFFVFILILFSIISFIGRSSPSDSSQSTNSKQTYQVNPYVIDVSMDVQPIISTDGRVEFNITTNLPDNPQLMISLVNDSINYNAQDMVNVSHGNAKTTQFANQKKGLTPGDYTLQIITSPANVQPDSVKSKIGENGQNFTGHLVSYDPVLGKVVDFEKSVTIY